MRSGSRQHVHVVAHWRSGTLLFPDPSCNIRALQSRNVIGWTLFFIRGGIEEVIDQWRHFTLGQCCIWKTSSSCTITKGTELLRGSWSQISPAPGNSAPCLVPWTMKSTLAWVALTSMSHSHIMCLVCGVVKGCSTNLCADQARRSSPFLYFTSIKKRSLYCIWFFFFLDRVMFGREAVENHPTLLLARYN